MRIRADGVASITLIRTLVYSGQGIHGPLARQPLSNMSMWLSYHTIRSSNLDSSHTSLPLRLRLCHQQLAFACGLSSVGGRLQIPRSKLTTIKPKSLAAFVCNYIRFRQTSIATLGWPLKYLMWALRKVSKIRQHTVIFHCKCITSIESICPCSGSVNAKWKVCFRGSR